jgi:hypothetical protein
VRHIEASESAKRFGSLVVLVLLDQESWSFGQEQKTDANDDGPCELDCYRDAVRSTVITTLSCVVDDRGEKQALRLD